MRAQVFVQGWLLDVEPAHANVAHGGHELTHVVQQGSGMRAWHTPRAGVSVRGWDVTSKQAIDTQTIPEVGDEILVAFEHGDARNVTFHFNPTEIAIHKSTPWKVEIGQVTRSAVRLVVRQRGSGPLRIAVQSSAAAVGSPGERWTTIL